ncbi:hypothetical protein ACTFIY_000632 [Dictyostelium cf. discoideum]
MINLKKKLSFEIYAKILFYANSFSDNNLSIFIDDYIIPIKNIDQSMETTPLIGSLHLVFKDKIRLPRKFNEKNIKFRSSMNPEGFGVDKDGREYKYNKFSNRDKNGIKFFLIECYLYFGNIENKIILRHFIENEISIENPPLSSIKIKNNDNMDVQPIEEFTGLIGSNISDIPLLSTGPIYSPNEDESESSFKPFVDNDEEFSL